MSDKMTYEERKDIASAITSVLNGLFRIVIYTSTQIPVVVSWVDLSTEWLSAIGRLEIQLARSCGMRWCEFLELSPSERYDLMLKEMEKEAP